MHKNWKAICQIPDSYVMWALAMLDINSDLGKKFIERFPEYFTQEKQAGPYPLSLMREKASERARKEGNTKGSHYIVSYNGVPCDIKKFIETFDKYGNHVVGDGFPRELPVEINPEAQQCEIVTWKNKQFVVLENNEGCEELYIAPAELVHIDCNLQKA